MKITKRQLKQLVKEVVEESNTSEADGLVEDMSQKTDVISYLQDNPDASNAEVADALGIRKKNVTGLRSRLRKEGLLPVKGEKSAKKEDTTKDEITVENDPDVKSQESSTNTVVSCPSNMKDLTLPTPKNLPIKKFKADWRKAEDPYNKDWNSIKKILFVDGGYNVENYKFIIDTLNSFESITGIFESTAYEDMKGWTAVIIQPKIKGNNKTTLSLRIKRHNGYGNLSFLLMETGLKSVKMISNKIIHSLDSGVTEEDKNKKALYDWKCALAKYINEPDTVLADVVQNTKPSKKGINAANAKDTVSRLQIIYDALPPERKKLLLVMSQIVKDNGKLKLEDGSDLNRWEDDNKILATILYYWWSPQWDPAITYIPVKDEYGGGNLYDYLDTFIPETVRDMPKALSLGPRVEKLKKQKHPELFRKGEYKKAQAVKQKEKAKSYAVDTYDERDIKNFLNRALRPDQIEYVEKNGNKWTAELNDYDLKTGGEDDDDSNDSEYFYRLEQKFEKALKDFDPKLKGDIYNDSEKGWYSMQIWA